MVEGDSHDDAEARIRAATEKLREVMSRSLSKDVAAIAEPVAKETAYESLAAEEVDEFEWSGTEEKARLENKRERIEQDSLRQDIEQRKKYARQIFWLVCAWLAAVLVITTASGAKRCPVTLSDAVLIALISGVSVNVIALFAIVARYLFPTRK